MRFFFLGLFLATAQAHEQLLLVIAEDMNRSAAQLQRYEQKEGVWKAIGRTVSVNLGRNGLGWGIGTPAPLPHDPSDPLKHEGDGRAPAGIFTLGPVFGYAARIATAMPYVQATKALVCIDDSRASSYNRVVPIRPDLIFGSFEWMRREDELYKIGVVVGHNEAAEPGRGSCIFLHIERAPGAGTAGCTSMNAAALAALIRWLDPAKAPLLIQVPRKSLPALRKRFPGVGP